MFAFVKQGSPIFHFCDQFSAILQSIASDENITKAEIEVIRANHEQLEHLIMNDPVAAKVFHTQKQQPWFYDNVFDKTPASMITSWTMWDDSSTRHVTNFWSQAPESAVTFKKVKFLPLFTIDKVIALLQKCTLTTQNSLVVEAHMDPSNAPVKMNMLNLCFTVVGVNLIATHVEINNIIIYFDDTSIWFRLVQAATRKGDLALQRLGMYQYERFIGVLLADLLEYIKDSLKQISKFKQFQQQNPGVEFF